MTPDESNDRLIDMSRRAVLRVDPNDLLRALGLPDDMRVLHLDTEVDPLSFKVVVSSPRFEPIPDFVSAPIIRVERRVYVETDTATGETTNVRQAWDFPYLPPFSES